MSRKPPAQLEDPRIAAARGRSRAAEAAAVQRSPMSRLPSPSTCHEPAVAYVAHPHPIAARAFAPSPALQQDCGYLALDARGQIAWHPPPVAVADRNDTRLWHRVGAALILALRANPDGLSLEQLRAAARTHDEPLPSPGTIHRTRKWLAEQHENHIDYDARSRRYRLRDPDAALPMEVPTADDLAAVIYAAAMIEPFGDEGLSRRLRSLIEQMDERIRETQDNPGLHPSRITATMTTGSPTTPELLVRLLRAARRNVVRIVYVSPWANTQRTYEIEPWQLRVHDGALYLRAWSRTSNGPRSFRVAQVRNVLVREGEPLSAAPIGPEAIWGESVPAFGVDDHEPGEATVRVTGGMARWLEHEVWHPKQRDRWIEPHETLERTLHYRSRREFVRRLLAMGDALVHVEPAELRAELRAHVAALHARFAQD